MNSRVLVSMVATVLAAVGNLASADDEYTLDGAREALREWCAFFAPGCGSSDDSTYCVWDDPKIRRWRDHGVDVVPLLMELVLQQDHTYVLKYTYFPEEGQPASYYWGDGKDARNTIATTAMYVLGKSRDPRAARFLMERFLDRNETTPVRLDAASRLIEYLEIPEVRALVLGLLLTPETYADNGLGRLNTGRATSICKAIAARQLEGNWTDLADALEHRLREDRGSMKDWEISHDETLIERLRRLSASPDARVRVAETVRRDSPASAEPGRSEDVAYSRIPASRAPGCVEQNTDGGIPIVVCAPLAILASILVLLYRFRRSSRVKRDRVS